MIIIQSFHLSRVCVNHGRVVPGNLQIKKLHYIKTVVEVFGQSGGSGSVYPGTHKGGKAVSHSVRYSVTLDDKGYVIVYRPSIR